ncbi:MAG: hypothetical protein WC247_06380 [Porticoccaceae bacterium]
MAIAKATLARLGRRWHRLLGWAGGAALILFGLSGLSHPLMTWFGPQQAVFFPPQGQFSSADIAAIPQVLAANGIDRPQLVKVVPTARGSMLQVTHDGGIQRQYFSLADGREYPGFDRRHGEWLARHYTGLADTPIRAMTLQTTFDNAYPAVNRLLPVWRVDFDSDDNLTAFVHTELNALASLTNDTRTLQQTIFQTFHSWRWLDHVEPARVAVLLVLATALAAMCLTGMAMALTLPRRALGGQRRWHRALAYGLWLPLLAFALSGLFHLLHNAGGGGPQLLTYAAPVEIAGLGTATAPIEVPAERPLNSITLVTGPGGRLLYRLDEPAGNPAHHVGHHARFDGTPTSRPARLVDAATGAPSPLTDEDLARFFAATHLDLAPGRIEGSAIVTQFGPDYDFRNKRLPVWRVDHPGGTAFIDPANGALVDHVDGADRLEGLSFSHLHKWNFLTPLTGRQIRDGLVSLVIVTALGFALLGFALLLRKGRAPSGERRG